MQELQRRYRRQTGGPWPPGETWLNWVVRLADGVPIGYVQVTIAAQAADLAWVVATDHQGHGYASEAARAVTGWLMSHGICTLTAHIPLAHPASAAVAAAVGLQPSGTFDETGEQIWVLENDAST
jgi:RimJ/RimL family protein N-acetyltransferase